jgi:NAD(P)-dependent dehydrogenase (short-subunit alcohol dehydrogenase family)
MAERGRGSIVNVASIAAHVGVGRIPQAAYSASKGGLLSLTRELAAQWGRQGIRVNALSPGFFRSEMTEGVFASEKLTDYVVESSMLRRVGAPTDLDGAVIFLASDASAFMTGQALVVDGGWTAL